MENFGVMDTMDDEQGDDYIPDTETDIDKESVHSKAGDGEKKQDKKEDKEKKDGDKEETKDKKEEKKEPKDVKKSKRRTYDLKKIDEKGTKILRKLARFLLK